LFSILGTTYGGNGTTTFGLPNLQSRVPMFWGQGPGLSQHFIGEMSGENAVTLTTSTMPSHNHTLGCNTAQTGASPENATFSGNARIGNGYASSGTPVQMNPQAIQLTGGSQPHNNMQPYLGLTFIIALQGVFPPRN
jgi:microcystin-dependent protein